MAEAAACIAGEASHISPSPRPPASAVPQEASASAPRASTATTRVPAVRDRRRWLLLALPLVIGLVIRLAYLWGVHRTQCPAAWWDDPSAPRDLTGRCPGDSYVYHYGANLVAQ